MMNITKDETVVPNTCLSRRLTEAELIIDFNAIDTVSMTFDECDFNSCSRTGTGKVGVFSEDKLRYYQNHPNRFNTKEGQERRNDITSSKAQETSAAATKTTEIDDATAATAASSTSFMTQNASRKSVRFGSLDIHEHSVELGGSGIPVCGPAITLGWEEESHVTIPSVEAYEDARPCLPRRGIEMLKPKTQRVDMLLASGYTLNQIRRCAQECEDIRKQRTKTVQQTSISDKAKSVMSKLSVWKKSRPVGSE